MSRDILFQTEEFIFSYRAGGVLVRDERILLQRPKDDDYAIIGGHVSSFETTEETLKREFAEELRAEIGIDRLLAVSEIFFPWGQKPCHQICLYYKVHLLNEGEIPLEGVFHGYDELGGERIEMDFCWVPLDELRQGTKVYPLELIPYILNDSGQIAHFVSKQL